MKVFSIRNVYLLTALVVSVNSGCVVRERRETTSKNSTTSIGSDISNFFTNLRCNIQNGAQKAKETVEGGYNYVKKRFSSDNANCENCENDNDNMNGNGATIENSDRIVFMNDDEEDITYKQIRKYMPISNVSEMSTIPAHEPMKNGNVTIGDRNALSAPIVCPKGQRLVDQKCVTIIEFRK